MTASAPAVPQQVLGQENDPPPLELPALLDSNKRRSRALSEEQPAAKHLKLSAPTPSAPIPSAQDPSRALEEAIISANTDYGDIGVLIAEGGKVQPGMIDDILRICLSAELQSPPQENSFERALEKLKVLLNRGNAHRMLHERHLVNPVVMGAQRLVYELVKLGCPLDIKLVESYMPARARDTATRDTAAATILDKLRKILCSNAQAAVRMMEEAESAKRSVPFAQGVSLLHKCKKVDARLTHAVARVRAQYLEDTKADRPSTLRVLNQICFEPMIAMLARPP